MGRFREMASRAFEAGEYGKALEYADKSLARDPYNMESLNIAAMAATQLGEYQKAVALYEQALLLQGETPGGLP